MKKKDVAKKMGGGRTLIAGNKRHENYDFSNWNFKKPLTKEMKQRAADLKSGKIK